MGGRGGLHPTPRPSCGLRAALEVLRADPEAMAAVGRG